ncbi:MAG: XdhC family protein, partial [Acidimicrobiaceae bacterium]|nr:XdhC family protein [Acidimicrobiaceae bacterium]
TAGGDPPEGPDPGVPGGDPPEGPDPGVPGGDAGDGAPDELVIGSVDDLLEGRILDQDTSVVLVTRNVDVDSAALPALLATGAGYVGVMGSERRWATTRARLEAEGVDPAALDRVHAPIGIEVGAETPEEIALSIMAEVVAHRRT